jgi:hypothetical protein
VDKRLDLTCGDIAAKFLWQAHKGFLACIFPLTLKKTKTLMIRLALAVGFLAVFGLAAYAIVLLLTNYFSKKEKPKQSKF